MNSRANILNSKCSIGSFNSEQIMAKKMLKDRIREFKKKRNKLERYEFLLFKRDWQGRIIFDENVSKHNRDALKKVVEQNFNCTSDQSVVVELKLGSMNDIYKITINNYNNTGKSKTFFGKLISKSNADLINFTDINNEIERHFLKTDIQDPQTDEKMFFQLAENIDDINIARKPHRISTLNQDINSLVSDAGGSLSILPDVAFFAMCGMNDIKEDNRKKGIVFDPDITSISPIETITRLILFNKFSNNVENDIQRDSQAVPQIKGNDNWSMCYREIYSNISNNLESIRQAIRNEVLNKIKYYLEQDITSHNYESFRNLILSFHGQRTVNYEKQQFNLTNLGNLNDFLGSYAIDIPQDLDDKHKKMFEEKQSLIVAKIAENFNLLLEYPKNVAFVLNKSFDKISNQEDLQKLRKKLTNKDYLFNILNNLDIYNTKGDDKIFFPLFNFLTTFNVELDDNIKKLVVNKMEQKIKQNRLDDKDIESNFKKMKELLIQLNLQKRYEYINILNETIEFYRKIKQNDDIVVNDKNQDQQVNNNSNTNVANNVNKFHQVARYSRYSKISQQEFNNYYINLYNDQYNWCSNFANTNIYSNQLTYTIAKCLDRYYKRYKNNFIDPVSNNIRKTALIHSFCSSFIDTLDWCSKNNYNANVILQNYFFFDSNDNDLFENRNAFDGFNKLVQSYKQNPNQVKNNLINTTIKSFYCDLGINNGCGIDYINYITQQQKNNNLNKQQKLQRILPENIMGDSDIDKFHYISRNNRAEKIKDFYSYYNNTLSSYDKWKNNFLNTKSMTTYTIAKCLYEYYKKYKYAFVIDQTNNNIREDALIHSFCSSFIRSLQYCDDASVMKTYFFLNSNDNFNIACALQQLMNEYKTNPNNIKNILLDTAIKSFYCDLGIKTGNDINHSIQKKHEEEEIKSVFTRKIKLLKTLDNRLSYNTSILDIQNNIRDIITKNNSNIGANISNIDEVEKKISINREKQDKLKTMRTNLYKVKNRIISHFNKIEKSLQDNKEEVDEKIIREFLNRLEESRNNSKIMAKINNLEQEIDREILKLNKEEEKQKKQKEGNEIQVDIVKWLGDFIERYNSLIKNQGIKDNDIINDIKYSLHKEFDNKLEEFIKRSDKIDFDIVNDFAEDLFFEENDRRRDILNKLKNNNSNDKDLQKAIEILSTGNDGEFIKNFYATLMSIINFNNMKKNPNMHLVQATGREGEVNTATVNPDAGFGHLTPEKGCYYFWTIQEVNLIDGFRTKVKVYHGDKVKDKDGFYVPYKIDQEPSLLFDLEEKKSQVKKPQVGRRLYY